jgi:hypothetical protein
VYRWGDALAWAQSRLSPPRRTTSEHDTSAGKPVHAEECAAYRDKAKQ